MMNNALLTQKMCVDSSVWYWKCNQGLADQMCAEGSGEKTKAKQEQ